MMEQEWAAILARFGQEVTLTAPEGEPVAVRAFVQPLPLVGGAAAGG